MVGNKLEQNIIKLYNEDITALHSINQIAQRLHKAYPYINKKVTSLIRSSILKKTIIGRAHLCGINLNNDEATFLLILNEIQKKNKTIEKDQKLVELISRIHEVRKVVTTHLALLVGKRLIFVLETLENKKILEKSASLSSFQLETYTKSEFLKLLLEEKQVLDNHVVLFGYESFYQMLQEIQGSLRIKYSPLLK